MSNILDKIRLSGVTYDIIDATALHTLDDNVTSGGTNAVKGSGVYNAITAVTQAIADQHYQTSGDVVTLITQGISGKVDTSVFETYTGTTVPNLLNGKADNEDLNPLFGAVAYDSNSKRINFYHESTTGAVLTYIDATDFVKDGFLESVEIKDVTIEGQSVTCLVFTWNTDAGIQTTNLPISEIFDPSNYVDVATFAAYSAATKTSIDGKASTATTTSINNTLTAHTASTSVHVTSSEKSTWSGKQDALVNQVNIKSINGTSLLGSGNIDIETGGSAYVDGTTLVFI